MQFERSLIANVNAEYGIINKNNYTKRCIMRKIRSDSIDIKGKTFGMLTALEPISIPGKRGLQLKCRCLCKKICYAVGSQLRDGSRKSCGCKGYSRIYETAVNSIYTNYKRRAKKRKIPFYISKAVFEKLIKDKCFYCGSNTSNVHKLQKSKKTVLQYNGIDRKDNSFGYMESNCVSCCKNCNISKSDLSFDVWISHINKIISYQGITNGT